MKSDPFTKIAQTKRRTQKRADLVAEDIKSLITQKNLHLGDRLPAERDLQELFGVSKSTIREALKSLEVQGLITVSTGPRGGATLVEVRLDRTVQFLQNYLFFKDIRMVDLYASRRLLEPELAAGAVPHLSDEHFRLLEENISVCSSSTSGSAHVVYQRQSDLDFHDILASANPNAFLRFNCEVINALLKQLVVYSTDAPASEHLRFGHANVKFHKAILKAARDRDADKVRTLMCEHMDDALGFVQHLKGRLDGRLIQDSDMFRR